MTQGERPPLTARENWPRAATAARASAAMTSAARSAAAPASGRTSTFEHRAAILARGPCGGQRTHGKMSRRASAPPHLRARPLGSPRHAIHDVRSPHRACPPGRIAPRQTRHAPAPCSICSTALRASWPRPTAAVTPTGTPTSMPRAGRRSSNGCPITRRAGAGPRRPSAPSGARATRCATCCSSAWRHIRTACCSTTRARRHAELDLRAGRAVHAGARRRLPRSRDHAARRDLLRELHRRRLRRPRVPAPRHPRHAAERPHRRRDARVDLRPAGHQHRRHRQRRARRAAGRGARQGAGPFRVFRTGEYASSDVVRDLDVTPLRHACAQHDLATVDALLAARPLDLHAPATVMFTSGSTGMPKGVVFSQYNLVTKRFARAAALPSVGRDEVLLCYLPLFHTFGRFLEMLGSIYWGGTYVFAGSPSAEALIAELGRVRPTGLISIPIRWTQIREQCLEAMDREADSAVEDALFRHVVGDRLRWGLSAAGFLDPKVFRFFQRHGVDLCSGFGMTEATGGITMTPPGVPRRARRRPAGLPRRGCATRPCARAAPPGRSTGVRRGAAPPARRGGLRSGREHRRLDLEPVRRAVDGRRRAPAWSTASRSGRAGGAVARKGGGYGRPLRLEVEGTRRGAPRAGAPHRLGQRVRPRPPRRPRGRAPARLRHLRRSCPITSARSTWASPAPAASSRCGRRGRGLPGHHLRRGALYAEDLRRWRPGRGARGAARPGAGPRPGRLAGAPPPPAPVDPVAWRRAVRDLLGSGEGISAWWTPTRPACPGAPPERLRRWRSRRSAGAGGCAGGPSGCGADPRRLPPLQRVVFGEGTALHRARRQPRRGRATGRRSRRAHRELPVLRAAGARAPGRAPSRRSGAPAGRPTWRGPGAGVLEAAPPFLAWRALVLGCPRFYPDLPAAARAGAARVGRGGCCRGRLRSGAGRGALPVRPRRAGPARWPGSPACPLGQVDVGAGAAARRGGPASRWPCSTATRCARRWADRPAAARPSATPSTGRWRGWRRCSRGRGWRWWWRPRRRGAPTGRWPAGSPRPSSRCTSRRRPGLRAARSQGALGRGPRRAASGPCPAPARPSSRRAARR